MLSSLDLEANICQICHLANRYEDENLKKTTEKKLIECLSVVESSEEYEMLCKEHPYFMVELLTNMLANKLSGTKLIKFN